MCSVHFEDFTDFHMEIIRLLKFCNGNGNGNGIYIPHQIYIHIQMRFTLLQYKGEIDLTELY